MTKSSLQVLETLPHKVLLPCQSFQAHYDLVRSCSWMCSSEDEVVTCGDDSSTCFWDLKNTSQPLNLENTSFMPLRTCSCLLYQGVFTTSDDSYRYVLFAGFGHSLRLRDFFQPEYTDIFLISPQLGTHRSR